MSYKPEVSVDGVWSQNGLAFATREEAQRWADDLLMRWFVPTDARAVESDQPVNAEIKDNAFRMLPKTEVAA